MRRWRAILLKVVVLVLLGAIVNIATAWGLSCSRGVGVLESFSRKTPNDADLMRWRRYAPSGFTSQPNILFAGDGAIGYLALEMRYSAPPHNGMAEYELGSVQEAGWPCPSMAGLVFAERTQGVWTSRHVQTVLWVEIGDFANNLPLRPMWPGFAINTVFYAGILWMLFAVPFALRRRRRIKRGLCPKCGYDLRGGKDPEKCPECGSKLRPPEVCE